MPNPSNQQIIDEFRANHGQVGGSFEGARLLLLTTVGARTGTRHTTPLGYLPDGGEQVLVLGSPGGGPKHPDWYHNLVANPHVTVEDGTFVYDARAVVLHGADRDSAFARAVEADSGWADEQEQTSRAIPVVALQQIPGPPRFAGDGTPSFVTALTQIHDAFRRELALVRAEVAASGPGIGAQLRVNCLTLCAGLHGHHTREDEGMFPALIAQHPHLGPTMQRLREQHHTIAALIGDLQAVLVTEDADSRQLLAEVDRLIDDLYRHLTYEEQQLSTALSG
jgi:deazaflavin-dependent oxidoreductase (nitroreductase family)